ncbi:N-acetylmuramoyl-L-alanine amidase family protein [Dielma fastidiosa]|uniref:N-acetylmuramoyl-L-alanine amidase family protein n=1 Tax=Dielma fastidiosa TaxID=1034346 RepID=UPI000E5579F5|nr:hypothetical protein [Dielma fastidiosa]RHN00996.1 hypothetical protein DWZ33_09215 [Dielma fastidiosa]
MKSNKTKSAMTALVVAAMLCSAAMPIRAAEAQWVNNNGTWSYVKEDGSIAKGWIKDGDCWYAFDDNGAMRTGWIASNEHWYFMGESGVMQADAWVEDNGARYYIKGTGVMAKDYVKDGYELTEDGKAIPLAESKSVVLTDPEAIEGEVIEGNLYVDVTTAKALELKGVTVKGKLVVIGDNQTAGKLTITDSKIESISTQTRNTEVVLSGETEVKTIVLEETAAVTPDKNFKGEVEKIEVQSTTKGEIVIEVPAQEVSTRTYASVDIQAPVESLEVKTDTQIKVNADVKNVVVTESAKDTKVEVSKGNTVGTITADAPVKIEGSGTINKVEANVDGVEAGKDTVIKDVETGKDVEQAPEVNKPSTGGSSGGSSTSSYTVKYAVDGSISFDVPAAVTVTSGSTITEPAKPADAPEGYSYKWVTSDGKPFDFSSKIRNSMTLTLILTNNDFAGGNGSEQFPYLIENHEQITKIGDHFSTKDSYNYKLISDITIPAGHIQMSNFTGVFDGDNHTITLPDSDSVIKDAKGGIAYSWFASSSYGDATFKNFTLEHGSQGILSLLETANMNIINSSDGKVYESVINENTILFDSITINSKDNKVVEVTANDNNEAPLITFSGVLNTVFNDVENNLSVKRTSGNVYVSFYVGGYVQTKLGDIGLNRTKYLKFNNCVNHGNMDVTYASLYLGNGSQGDNLVIEVNDCTNTGVINGYQESEPFAAMGHGNLTADMKSLNDNLKDNNYTNVDEMNISYDETAKKYKFSKEDAVEYYVTYTAYARDDNGTVMISVELNNDDLSLTESKYGMLRMIAYTNDYSECEFTPLNSYGMEYYVDTDKDLIVVKLGIYADYDGIQLNSAARVTVTAIDSNGKVIAIGTAK